MKFDRNLSMMERLSRRIGRNVRNYLMLAITFLTGFAFVIYSSSSARMYSVNYENQGNSFAVNEDDANYSASNEATSYRIDSYAWTYDIESEFLEPYDVESDYLEDIGDAIYNEDIEYDFTDIFEELLEETEENNYGTLVSELHNYISKYNCYFGIYFVDLESGEEFGINDTEDFLAASTFKIPLNLYVYDRIREGTIEPNTILQYTQEDYEGGAGIICNAEPYGKSFTIKELLRLSIVYSDNVAANIMLRYVGKAKVKNYMRESGGIIVDDNKNVSCPRDMALYLRKVYELSESGDPLGRELMENMINTKFHDRLPALLPKDVRVAHKTGNLIGIVHDVGIVYAKKPYIIVVMVKNVKSDKSANKAIANISKMTYDYVKVKSESVDD